MTRYPTLWRRYGSIWIAPDGRVRYSDWTYREMSYVGILAHTGRVDVEFSSQPLFHLDVSRGRVVFACFPFPITPDELRGVVRHLRRANRGIERWIVPALEWASISASSFNHPETAALIPELLKSCQDLPVAAHWKKVRGRIFKAQEIARRKAATRSKPR